MRVILLTVFILFASVAHAAGGPAWHPLAKEDASDRAPRFVAASRTDGVSVDLSLPGFFMSTIRVDEMDCQNLSLPGWQTNSETGVPLLPQLVKCIAIPSSCTAEEISIEIQSSDTLTSNVSLAPVPKLINGKYEYRRDPDVYSKNSWYPENPCSVERTGFIREQKTAWIRINPVQYNPVSNKILIHKNLRLKIRFNNQETVNLGPFEAVGPELFLNADKFQNPTPKPGNQGSVVYPTDLLNASVQADYILITTEGLIHTPVLDSLAHYRASFSGLDVAVVNASDVYTQFPDADQSKSIRGFLIHAYAHWTSSASNDSRPVYVLLIGDGNPSSPNSITGYASKPADHLYACVNDDNGDGVIDDNDQVCDLMLGRLSVDDEPELGSVFRKMRRYESALSEQETWRMQICLVNGFADSLGAVTVKAYYDDFSETAAGQDYYTISETLNKRELGTESLRSSFINALNAGRGICDINTHGMLDGWSDVGGQIMFRAGDMPLLNNGDRLPVALSFACYTGDFMNAGGDCLGETLVNASDVGAIAFIGSGLVEDLFWNLPFNSLFLKILMSTQSMSLGTVFTASQWSRGDLSTGYNLLGDPALSFARQATLLPDLEVSDHDIKVTADPTYIASYSILVHNWGGSMADSVFVQFYIGDPDIGGSPFCDPLLVENIPPFGGEKRVFLTKINDMPKGPVTLYVKVDSRNIIVESREDNNIAAAPTRTFYPTLYVTANAFWGRNSGDPVGITAFIHNWGQIRADSVTVQFFTALPESGGVRVCEDQLIAVVRSQSEKFVSIRLNNGNLDGISLFIRIFFNQNLPECPYKSSSCILTEHKAVFYRLNIGLNRTTDFYRGAITGDLNNDGFIDVFQLGSYWYPPILFQNSRKYLLNDISSQTGSLDFAKGYFTDGALLDFDNDRRMDIYLYDYQSEIDAFRSLLVQNLANGNFKGFSLNNTNQVIQKGRAVFFFDYDHDALPDMLFECIRKTVCDGRENAIRLFRNNGDGSFLDVTARAGIDTAYHAYCEQYPLLVDYDNDGEMDLFVFYYNHTSDCLPWSQQYGQTLYRNNGNGMFVNVTNQTGFDPIPSYPASGKFVDYNSDGEIEYIGISGDFYRMVNGRYMKMQNKLAYTFQSLRFGDYNNDGYPDLYVDDAVDEDHMNRIANCWLKNDGSGSFSPDLASTCMPSYTFEYGKAAIVDFDNDGFVDLLTDYIYRNPGNDNHWIRISLKGRQSNSFGIGARVCVFAGVLAQTRDIFCELGNASDLYNLHFGLAQNATIDSVVVRWPSHVVDKLYNVSADRLLTVEEGVGDASVPTEYVFSQNYPNPFNDQTSIRYAIPGDGHSPGKMKDISIVIYDVLGRKVATLQDKPQPPGNYLVLWDGKDRTGIPVSTGVYLCRIKAGKHIQTIKMLLLR